MFVMGDVHLSFAADKPMDVFRGWQDHVRRMENQWCAVVSDNDTVVIPGDISWAMRLPDALDDLRFLNNLPGRKILGKGNHDLWWETMKKMNAFLEEHALSRLRFLFNNAYEVDGVAVCGTRGWMAGEGEDDRKILLREAGRLELSLQAAVATGLEPVAFLHYPPVLVDRRCEELVAVLRRYGVRRCYYGHLHGPALQGAVNGPVDGITYRVTSCDAVEFTPLLVEKR